MLNEKRVLIVFAVVEFFVIGLWLSTLRKQVGCERKEICYGTDL